MAIATGDVIILTGKLKGRKAVVLPITDGDDCIQVDAAAVARATAGDTTGTFSAWINPDNIADTETIVGCGDKDVVEFLEFNIEAGLLTCRCTDATTIQFVSQADAIHIVPHKWQHVAVVQPDDGGGVRFYVNGKRIASTNDTTTDVNEWFDELDDTDTMRIGSANKAGNDTYTQEFAGAISDVKYWNRALTAKDIERDYKGSAQHATKDGLIGAANTSDGTYLQNHWDFDGDLVDNGLGADNGTVVSAVYLDPNYSELTSLCRHYSLVVADVGVSLSVSGETGTVLIPKA